MYKSILIELHLYGQMCEVYKFLFTAGKTNALTFYIASFERRPIHKSYSIVRFIKLSYNS